MKTLLSVFAFLLIFKLSAQLSGYHKMLGDTNRWFVSGYGIGAKTNGATSNNGFGKACIAYYEAIKDSIYNSKTYKLFNMSASFPPGAVCSSAGISPNGIYSSSIVREDTIAKKIYIIPEDSTTEILAVDFGMNIGDSLYLPFPSASNVLNNGYYKVDSIILKNEILGQRQHFYLSKYDSPVNPYTGRKYYIEWIESIGAIHFPLNLVFADNYVFDGANVCNTYQYNSYVTCKVTNRVKYYQDSCMLNYAQSHTNNGYYFSGDNCEFYGFSGNVKELSFMRNFELFPNPVSQNKITLKFDAIEYKPIDIIVYNNLGEKILEKRIVISTTKNVIELNDLELLTGLYTLQIKGISESATVKFIKE